MPEDSKKSHKGKHDAKEQRKPRQSRHQGPEKSEKKVEKPEESKVQPSKPVYDDPGPEFYKNLKRETDEILKITEEANSKFKKKEIQSNWTKYEMPIESYEDMVEQENLGADYEKLIETPMSLGGHFQFKHEKNWDLETGPSLYDKYFEINMDNLATALSTMPFYERNSIDKSVFSETDILSMENRSVKYKRKYYNDKTFTTAGLEAEDNILSSMKEGFSKSEESTQDRKISMPDDIDLNAEDNSAQNVNNVLDETPLREKIETETVISNNSMEKQVLKDKVTDVEKSLCNIKIKNEEIDDIDDLLGPKNTKEISQTLAQPDVKNISKQKTKEPEVPVPQVESKPVIESPEDLEKWLDDFLDK